MTRTWLRLLGAGLLAIGFVCFPATPASAQLENPGAATVEDVDDDDDDTGLWGLAGLLGLIGLAGLARNKHHDRHEDVHRTRTDPNARVVDPGTRVDPDARV